MKTTTTITLITATALGSILAACTTGPTQSNLARFDYTCDNGERASMIFAPQRRTATLIRGASSTELRRHSSPINTFYQGGQTTVMVNNDRTQIGMTIGMMAQTNCQGRQTGGPPMFPGQPPMPPAPPMPPIMPPRPGQPVPSPAEMRVSYQCDNGEQVDVRFFPQQGIAVLVRGGQNVELNQSRTPPGYTYTNGQTTLRVGPDRLTMQMNVGMMATANCRAR